MGDFRAFTFWAAAGLGFIGLACTPSKPAQWAQGGAPLQLGPALWAQPGFPTLELRADGRVVQAGSLQFILDAHGRVTDDDAAPVALLAPDGQVFSADNMYSGRVGLRNASPPWDSVAWIRIEGDGTVLSFDEEGKAYRVGRWSGCEGAALRACTLVTHLVLLSSVRRDRASFYQTYPDPYSPYPFTGVGVGFGF